MTSPLQTTGWLLDRRSFLGAAAAPLLARALAAWPQSRTHHPARAKRVIFLGMFGGPSQLDLFEHKPALDGMDGEPVPESLVAGEQFAFIGDGKTSLLASPWRKAQHGQSGTWLSELLPCHRAIVDHVCFVHSLRSSEINHVPAQLFLQTGSPRAGRPAWGAWVDFGLGSDNPDLPGYVVLASGKAARCGAGCWGAGFLPGSHQGVQLRAAGDPVPFLADPPGFDRALRRATLDAVRALNERRLAREVDPELAARVDAFEMAFRMQASAPPLVDLATEDAATLALYGAEPGKPSFAANCLLARRLVESGVRCVQLVHGGWDHHGGDGDQNLVTNLPQRCREVDRGAAALVLDLARRGLLDETLVVFGGEFGRTPMIQGERAQRVLGRDHSAPRSPSGSQAAGSSAATTTARPTSSASGSPATRSTCTTCRRPSCTCSASTTCG
jgi:hypothetical protein